ARFRAIGETQPAHFFHANVASQFLNRLINLLLPRRQALLPPAMNRTLLAALFLAVTVTAHVLANPARDDSAAEKLGWDLASKGYTFRALTLSESIDIARDLGLKYFEMNPTQKWSKEKPVNTDQSSSAELRDEIKKKF